MSSNTSSIPVQQENSSEDSSQIDITEHAETTGTGSTSTSFVKRKEFWESKSLDNIYDLWTSKQKGLCLGIIANKVFKTLKENNFYDGPPKLCHLKKDIHEQKENFLKLCDGGKEIVYNILASNEIPAVLMTRDTELIVHNVKALGKSTQIGNKIYDNNVLARIIHLAEAGNDNVSVLEDIFSSMTNIPRAGRRAVLDDPQERSNVKWNLLAEEYINNPEWTPVNEFEDQRLNNIDPRLPPHELYTGQALRTVFSGLKTHFTILSNNYHKSGQLVEGDGEGDDDFYENFAKTRGGIIFLYMHKLWGKFPPKYCTRDLEVQQKCDIGTSPELTKTSSSSVNNQNKRQKLPLEETPESFTSAAEENYFKQLQHKVEDEQEEIKLKTAKAKIDLMKSAYDTPMFDDAFDATERSAMIQSYKDKVKEAFS